MNRLPRNLRVIQKLSTAQNITIILHNVSNIGTVSGVQHEVSVESMGGSGPEEGEEETVAEKEGEASTKKPAMVALSDDCTVMQIDCGTFHTGKWRYSKNIDVIFFAAFASSLCI